MPNTAITPLEHDPYAIELSNHLLNELTEYAIFMMDASGKIVTWNPGVQRLLGYTESEFINNNFSIIFNEDDLKDNVHARELFTARQKGRADDQRWHKRKDGSLFWANGILTLSTGEIFGKRGFVKIMRDQTVQKKYETELANYAKKLATTNKDLVNFAGVVSHDLNAPLHTVLGFTSIIEEKARGVDEEVDLSIRNIREGAERMLSLVSELLEFSSSTNQEILLENVDSEQVLHHVLASLGSSIENAHALITHDPLPHVKADSVQLGRVFQNLIDNAMKFAQPGTPAIIHIAAVEHEGQVTFSIFDNGIGIADEELEKIFVMFERFSTPNKPGYGIGLATCKRIVELLGGELSVESKLGEGSTFIIKLAAAELVPEPREVASSIVDGKNNDVTTEPLLSK